MKVSVPLIGMLTIRRYPIWAIGKIPPLLTYHRSSHESWCGQQGRKIISVKRIESTGNGKSTNRIPQYINEEVEHFGEEKKRW